MNELLGEEPETSSAVSSTSPLNGILTEVLESHGIKVRVYDPVNGEDIELSDNK